MSRLPESLNELQTLFNRWSESLQNIKAMEKRIFYIGQEMPALLLNHRLFRMIMTHIVMVDYVQEVQEESECILMKIV